LTRWQEALRRLNLKESSLRAYISSGYGFESWLRSARKTDLDCLIDGDLETAKATILEYVRPHLGGSPLQNRGFIGHISRLFSASGRRLPFKELYTNTPA